MTSLTLDGGDILLASEDDRLITARLVPFGEVGRTNLGEFTIDRGVLELPEDASVAILNDGHRRELPLGAGVVYAERADGVYGSWRLAKGEAGDKALAGIKDGSRRAVSVEADIVVENGRAVSGRIFAAALVSPDKRPAFPSALLMATATDTAIQDPQDPTTAAYSTMSKDPATGDTYETETTVEETTEDDPDTGATIQTRTTTEVTTITPGDPAEGSAPVAAQTVPTDGTVLAERPAARVPASLLGGTARRPKAPAAPAGVSKGQLFAMLAAAAPSHRFGSWNTKALEALRSPAVAGTLYAELDDITFDAAGSPADMIVPQWAGELWSGRAFQRRWIPLFNAAPLTSPSVKAWRWKTKPEVEKWEGNKTDVPSGPVETEPYDVEAQPFAGAHDVDRRYRDFNVTEFWDGYFAAMTESYARKSDAYVPDELFTTGDGVRLTPVTGGTVPASVNAVLTRIVDGALAVLDEDLPSFAVVSKADYRDLMLVRDQDNLAFLNASLGLEEGAIESFRVIPSGHVGLTGGKTLVGCRSAATVHELPGSPIRIEGLDVARGGIDPGLFGYTALAIHNPAALALVSPAA